MIFESRTKVRRDSGVNSISRDDDDDKEHEEDDEGGDAAVGTVQPIETASTSRMPIRRTHAYGSR